MVCKRPSGSVLFCTETNKRLIPHPQLNSSHPLPSQKQTAVRLSKPRDMQARMIDRYVPERDNAYQRRSDAPRSSSTFNNPAFQSAPSLSNPHYTRRHSGQHTPSDDTPISLDKSLPKNFPQPLTCFFWHKNGRCNKRDIDCAYAHYDTGFMAGAPVTPLDCAFSSIIVLTTTC